jgi:hypothetical protein
MGSDSAGSAADLPSIRSTTIMCQAGRAKELQFGFATLGTMMHVAWGIFSASSRDVASTCEMFRNIRNSARLSRGARHIR